MRHLFLDCDGVLADFDAAAWKLFGQDSRAAEAALGSREFWRRIRYSGDFYRNLPLTPDALELYRAVAHLSPVILTAARSVAGLSPRKWPGLRTIFHRFP